MQVKSILISFVAEKSNIFPQRFNMYVYLIIAKADDAKCQIRLFKQANTMKRSVKAWPLDNQDNEVVSCPRCSSKYHMIYQNCPRS